MAIHTYIYITHIHTYIPTFVHTYLPTYIHKYIHTYLCVYVSACTVLCEQHVCICNSNSDLLDAASRETYTAPASQFLPQKHGRSTASHCQDVCFQVILPSCTSGFMFSTSDSEFKRSQRCPNCPCIGLDHFLHTGRTMLSDLQTEPPRHLSLYAGCHQRLSISPCSEELVLHVLNHLLFLLLAQFKPQQGEERTIMVHARRRPNAAEHITSEVIAVSRSNLDLVRARVG